MAYICFEYRVAPDLVFNGTEKDFSVHLERICIKLKVREPKNMSCYTIYFLILRKTFILQETNIRRNRSARPRIRGKV